jgi:signal transduction histidine kinase
MDEERRTSLREPIRHLMRSLDYEATLGALAGIALPDVGAWSIVDLLEPSGEIRRLAIVHPDPAMERVARSLVDGWPPDRNDPLGVPVVVRTGRSQIVSEVPDEMLVRVAGNSENLAALRQLGIGSLLVVPLTGRDEILGAITFVTSKRGHQYGARDLARAEELAALCALTVDHARLRQTSDEARRLADETSAETRRQKRDLEQIMEIQARLVRGFSHDVKNPLGAAQGYASLLEAGVLDDLTPRQRNSVVRIRSSITAALQLIDDLIEYARNKTGKLDFRAEAVNVGEMAREIAEEYRAQRSQGVGTRSGDR